jgi:aminoglycoside phosphotransferase (APT) family kinase protein
MLVDDELRLVVLSDVPGRPLREAILERDLNACARVGVALAGWHRTWSGANPDGLEPHTPRRELEILDARLTGASRPVAEAVVAVLAELAIEWPCSTVAHRDLYEEQILLGDRVGLIDVDDAALGPPELDMGNLVAHLELLERRRGIEVVAQAGAILNAYASAGGTLDPQLLDRCRTLSLLRLACINDDVELVRLAVRERVAV